MEKRKKPHRRVVVLSEADKKIAASGEAVAWDAISARPISQEPDKKPTLTGRDQQLQADVPPHW